jgi:RimJ/RimL family protein N-acetyltransferase
VTDVELRPLEPADFPTLVSWVHSAEFLLQCAGPGFRYPLTEDQLEAHYRGCTADPPVREMWKAVEAGAPAMIGHVELSSLDRTGLSATVSRVIVGDPRRRGEGIGTAMMRLVIERAFGPLGLRALDLYVFDFNKRAIDCYGRVGFRIDVRMENVRRMGDTYWSMFRMVLERPT